MKKIEPNGEKTDFSVSSGGLYSKITMSLKTANILTALSCAALILTGAAIIANAGFTVSFDTDGGSSVAPQKVFYSEYIKSTEKPKKEGFSFAGWYSDSDCTSPWEPSENKVTQSMTLYAGWIPNDNNKQNGKNE